MYLKVDIKHAQTHRQNLVHGGDLIKALTNLISYLLNKL